MVPDKGMLCLVQVPIVPGKGILCLVQDQVESACVPVVMKDVRASLWAFPCVVVTVMMYEDPASSRDRTTWDRWGSTVSKLLLPGGTI